MIRDGKPYTYDNGFVDDWLISDKLTIQEQEEVLGWIEDNIIPRKTVNSKYSSYILKYLLEKDTGIHLSNNQFKDAMLIAGYDPINPNKVNWHYCISQKSPAIINYGKK